MDVTGFVFPGGEVSVSLPVTRRYASSVTINAYIKSSDDVMALVMVNEAVDRLLKPLSKRLVMPYLPYARQDRACNPGEAHGARAFATLINGMGFDMVSVMDAHSEVGVACINNCESVKQCDLIPADVIKKLKHWHTLVCPDAGARGLLRVELEDGEYVLYDQQTPAQEAQGELKTVFIDGVMLNQQTLAEIRERVG